MIKKILKPGYVIYRKILKIFFLLIFNVLNLLPRGRYATSDGLDEIFGKKTKVKLNSELLEFHSPNWITRYRAKSILLKEPETLDWIRSMKQGSVLWDVGANIGTFTLVAARSNIRVVAIEPSFMNIELLNRNIISNNVADLVTIIPLGVGNQTAVLNFFMTHEYLTWGGAHNSLGTNIGSGGKPLIDPLKIHSLCFSIDHLLDIFNLPHPSHLKIDVDGLELEVLEGAVKTLKNIDSVLIEVDSEFIGHVAGIKEILEKNGFIKKISGIDSHGSHNQIWQKASNLP